MNDVSDDVVAKAQAGDIEAFELIFRNYSGYVYNIALRIVRTREDAQEVTQDVFLNVHRNLRTFRGQSSLRTWIYRVAVNTALNQAKRGGQLQAGKVEFHEEYSASTLSEIHQKADQEHREELIGKLLNHLTPDQRACVVLRNIQGLSYQDIADVLKIDVNAVKSRLKRAREKLLAVRQEAVDHGM